MTARITFILGTAVAVALVANSSPGWSGTLSINAPPVAGLGEPANADSGSAQTDAPQDATPASDGAYAVASPNAVASEGVPADAGAAGPQQSAFVRAFSYILQRAGR